MSEISGNLIYLSFSGSDVVGLISKSLNFTADMLDTTNQQSTGGWKTFIPGEKGATMSVNGVYSSGQANGATGAFSKLANGTAVTWKFGEKTSGENYWTGSGYISGLVVDGPKNDPASYSFDIQVSGPVTETSN